MRFSRLYRRPPGLRPAFALVATLTLMVLLTMIAVGLLSLANIQLREGGHEAHRREARANARLALQLAIGSLQKYAGPDQRVSAEASLLDSAPETAANDGVAHPHWTGVWRTTRPDGTSWYERTANDGGMKDHRWDQGWSASGEVMAWLVSGNEDQPMRYQPTAAGRDMVELVSAGATGNAEAEVKAPRVPLNGRGGESGGYAWWIGDEGVKANVATSDRFAATRLDSHGGGWQRVMMAQDAEYPDEPLAEEQRRRTIDHKTLGLTGDPVKRAGGFHDFTTVSTGLLCNVLEGGMKRDLSVYLQSDGTVDGAGGTGPAAAGVRDSDNLVGPADEADATAQGVGFARFRQRLVAPKFGLLRHWAQLADRASFAGPALTGILPKQEPRPGDMGDAFDGTNPRPVAIKEMDATSLVPTLVEGSLYYSISYYDRSSTPGDTTPYALRVHLYPRVVLWNPYNVRLSLPASALCLFINGSKTFEVTMADGKREVFAMNLGRGGAQRGSLLFSLDGLSLEPGECLVLSPTAKAPYRRTSPSSNRLTIGQAPDLDRSFYLDSVATGVDCLEFVAPNPSDPARWTSSGKARAGGLLPTRPLEFREVALPSVYGSERRFQADDYRMLWKSAGNSPSWTDADFDKLPMIQFVSCALQYGDNDELPVVWSERLPVPIEKTGPSDAGGLIYPPDRRTRDGFRLRWLNEHPSNQLGSGSLANTRHFDYAPVANWNVRSSYSLRSPWENLTDSVPAFFGAYTRDLFDDAVSWNGMQPVRSAGGAAGYPFGQPIEGTGSYVLFDVPRKETGVISLGMFQHVKMSEFIWHPSYALGNSLVDPRIGRTGTELERKSLQNRQNGGWNRYTIGWANDGRSDNQDQWAWYARHLLQNVVDDRPGDEQTVSYDLSFELNHTFWDRFFLSAGNSEKWKAFAKDSLKNPLPNGRLTLLPGQADAAAANLGDMHRAAESLAIDGAFNVNSTSRQAWKAMLSSTTDTTTQGRVSFPRLLNPPGHDGQADVPDSRDAWTGFRSLSEQEVDELAAALASEAKSRGPFLSLGDFVNRRLRDDPSGDKGAIQAAIDRTSINQKYLGAHRLANSTSLPDYWHRDNIADPTRLEQKLEPDSKAWGEPGFLTQADVLQVLGPALAARSDTFVIRTFGDSKDADGKVQATAWCEAVVQRLPEKLDPARPETSASASTTDWGRRFRLVSFRWLSRDEI